MSFTGPQQKESIKEWEPEQESFNFLGEMVEK